MNRIAALASALALLFAHFTLPARADDTTLALATLLGRVGQVSDGAVFAFRSEPAAPSGRLSILGTIVAPSPDPCVFDVTEGWHPPHVEPFALVTHHRYDLRRLAAVEFLATRSDLPSAALRTEVVPRDDPGVRGVRLRGPGLLCSRRFSLAPQPRYSGECDDVVDVWGFDEAERRRRIETALATLVAACPIR